MARRKPQASSGHTGLWLLLLLLALGVWLAQYLLLPLSIETLPRDVTVAPGSSAQATAEALYSQGVLPDQWRFAWLIRLTGMQSDIKAGTYRLSKPISPWNLLRILRKGETDIIAVTFIDGWSWRQIAANLAANAELRHDASALDVQTVAQALELPDANVEGWLFPDTYHVLRGSSELSLLRRAHKHMLQQLDKAWAQRDPSLPYSSPYQALIMASLIEKESGVSQDRRMIAAVFVNRLKKHMRLQTDPTVIYGLGDKYDGNLHKIDLETDTPYNTYTRDGLPPTPIAMPGAEALAAALNPAPSAALYFVARGDGSSEFSDTLEQHNRAVDRYQRRRQP